MTDYIEFSTKIKEKYPQYKDVDDLTLAQKMVEKYPQYKEQVTFEEATQPKVSEKLGIDLTPSGIPKMLAAGIAAPIQAIKDKSNLADAYDTVRNEMNTNPIYKHPVQDFATDMLGYSALPILRGGGIANFLGNAAIQGGVPGALESLKRGGNAAVGAGAGTGIAAVLQGVVPYAGKILSKPANYIGKKVIEGLTDMKPESLAQVIKPNSKALDLTEDTAQNLLMNTTERIQKDYKNLLDNAGLDVQRAALNLPEERGVFASSLKDALDDIYAGYSTGGIKELNPAYNNAGDIHETLTNLIDLGTDIPDVGRVSAKNLNDIMGNIKNYPLDWSKTSTKDRQNILKQVYGEFQRRLGNLSPELRNANYNYSKLTKFDDNEGVRQIINPNIIKGENIDSASRALRNYNSTVTKGNTNKNIQDLEKILVENGKEPFLNDIDDVNAAMDLLTQPKTGRNFLGAQTLAKGLVTPALKAVRKANQMGIPEKVQSIKDAVAPLAKLLPALGAKGAANMLYGRVEYNDY